MIVFNRKVNTMDNKIIMVNEITIKIAIVTEKITQENVIKTIVRIEDSSKTTHKKV